MKLPFATILLLVPALAFADEAADHVAKGTRFYNIQDWTHALDEYRQAYTIEPKPETLWAIAQVQRLSGDCRSAILSYKAFMRGASAAGANAASDWIKACEVDLEAQRKAVEAVTPEPPKPEPKPIVVERKPEPAPAPVVREKPLPPPAAEPRSWAFDPLGDVLFVTGIGGLAVGGAYLTVGMIGARDASAKPTSGQYDRAIASAHDDQVIGAIAGVGGLVLTGLSIWRFSHVRSSRSEVHVVPTAHGAFASYAVTF